MSDKSRAQYACDHCKQRKLKCTRELPQCSNCRSWTGECVYSRHGRIRRRPRSKVAQVSADAPFATTPQTQLSQAPPILTPPSDSSPAASTSQSTTVDDDYRGTSHSEKLLKDDSGQTFYLGPSPTASFLSQANANVEKLGATFRNSDLQSGAEKGLSELSSTFASISFEDASNVRTKVKSFRRANEVFFIPKRHEGERMIEIFEHSMEKGKPFFFAPPPNLVYRLAFEPANVDERGWLLVFNCIASTAISLIDSSDERLIRGLQWNIWMLIEDSTILLEPSLVNIQALIMVAVHTQEISTPSLCWLLISHACRMAQTLALHLPVPGPRDSITNIDRLFLFWSLFLIEKSLSLAFGRPSLLPGSFYKNVPPPSIEQLARFSPHKKTTTVSGISRLLSSDRSYGAVHVLRTMALAKIQGDIQDAFSSGARNIDAEKLSSLKKDLDHWFKVTKEETQHSEYEIGDPDERKAVRLGINFLKFQYHHLLVYLTRTDQNSSQICVGSARSAIEILDDLVSSSIEVYNGVVWQLLYQPFMPYFVIFGNIISDPHPDHCFRDLQLLRRVVLYFLQMHNNHPSAKKLEKVAETFTLLAEAYVRHSLQNPQAKPPKSSVAYMRHAMQNSQIRPPRSTVSHIRNAMQNLPAKSPMSTVPAIMVDESPPREIDLHPDAQQQIDNSSVSNPVPPFAKSLSPAYNTSQVDLDFNDFNDSNSDPMALLNFFSTASDINTTEADFNTQNTATWETGPEQQGESSGLEPNPLLQELENISQTCALNGTFDWFSWDQYDSTMTG